MKAVALLIFTIVFASTTLRAETVSEMLDRLDALPPMGRYREVIKVEIDDEQIDPLVDEMVKRIKSPHPEVKRAIAFYSSVFGVLCKEHEPVRQSLLRHKADFFEMVKTPLPSNKDEYLRAFHVRKAALEAMRYLPVEDLSELEDLLFELFRRMEDGNEFISLSSGMSYVLFSRKNWSDEFKERVRQYLLTTKPRPQLIQLYGIVQMGLLAPSFDAEIFKRLHVFYSKEGMFQGVVVDAFSHAQPNDILSKDAELTAALKAWMVDDECQLDDRFDLALLLHKQDAESSENVLSNLLKDKELKDSKRQWWSKKLKKQGLEHLLPK